MHMTQEVPQVYPIIAGHIIFYVFVYLYILFFINIKFK